MNVPHKHKDLIIAWANGEQIEYFNESKNKWCDTNNPSWCDNAQYRVKQKSFTITFNHSEIEVIVNAVYYYSECFTERENPVRATIVDILDKLDGAKNDLRP